MREAIAAFATTNVHNMTAWLDAIDDPARKLELFLRALEFHLPKLGRVEATAAGGEPLMPRASGVLLVVPPRDVAEWEATVAEQQQRLLESSGKTFQ